MRMTKRQLSQLEEKKKEIKEKLSKMDKIIPKMDRKDPFYYVCDMVKTCIEADLEMIEILLMDVSLEDTIIT